MGGRHVTVTPPKPVNELTAPLTDAQRLTLAEAKIAELERMVQILLTKNKG